MWDTPEGEHFTYEGRHHRVEASPALPKPVQRPRPPIIIGGYGAKTTPRLAARYADEFNLAFAPLDYFGAGCEVVRAACEAAGRDPETLRYTVALATCVGRDDAEVRRRAEAIDQDPDTLRKSAAAGTPPEVVERLHAFAEAGAQTAYLQILDLHDLDHLHLIAADVAPHV
jgi:alkanesulfonate monooxygenase